MHPTLDAAKDDLVGEIALLTALAQKLHAGDRHPDNTKLVRTRDRELSRALRAFLETVHHAVTDGSGRSSEPLEVDDVFQAMWTRAVRNEEGLEPAIDDETLGFRQLGVGAGR